MDCFGCRFGLVTVFRPKGFSFFKAERFFIFRRKGLFFGEKVFIFHRQKDLAAAETGDVFSFESAERLIDLSFLAAFIPLAVERGLH